MPVRKKAGADHALSSCAVHTRTRAAYCVQARSVTPATSTWADSSLSIRPLSYTGCVKAPSRASCS